MLGLDAEVIQAIEQVHDMAAQGGGGQGGMLGVGLIMPPLSTWFQVTVSFFSL